ncbi:MAG: sulfatase-like hydrolase/transferase [Pirellulales bacterium]
MNSFFNKTLLALCVLVSILLNSLFGAETKKQHGGAGSLRSTAPSRNRPNIVLIISDDQTYRDFGFMGNKAVRTPNLDRLAARSALFPNGYVPTSVCSPSLATILTGLYPHQSGIHFNHPPPGNRAFNTMTSRPQYMRLRRNAFYLIRSAETLPEYLVMCGYKSLQTGKFWEGHFSNAGFTSGMTIFRHVPGQTFGGNRRLANGIMVAHGNGDFGLKIGRETMQPIYDFIDDCVGKDPFFVWYAPYLPHQPHDAPRKYFDLYENTQNVPEYCIPYYASISQFDETIGDLMTYVERKGLIHNTLFVFVIDNGWTPGTRRHKTLKHFFHHTEKSKRSPFEDGVRSPILFSWNKHIVPGRHNMLCSSIDIVPTLLHLVGESRAARRLPGINLLDADTRDRNADRAVFGEIYPGDATSLGYPSQDVAYRWVRQGDFKLISPQGEKPWGNYLTSATLFNLVQDPLEETNLMDQPDYQVVASRLMQILDTWWTPGDDGDVPKPPMQTHQLTN